MLLLLLACPPPDNKPYSEPVDDSRPDSEVADDSGNGTVWHVELSATTDDLSPEILSFTVPFGPGDLPSTDGLRLSVDGSNLPLAAAPVYSWHLPDGQSNGIRTVLLQADASLVPSYPATLLLEWGDNLPGDPPRSDVLDPADPRISLVVDKTIPIAERDIQEVGGALSLVEISQSSSTLFAAVQPRVQITVPTTQWIDSGVLGPTAPTAQWGAAFAAYGQGLSLYSRSAAYIPSYSYNINGILNVADPLQWEYGRCNTLLQAGILTEDPQLLQEGMLVCSWYSDSVDQWADSGGFFLQNTINGLHFHGRDLFHYAQLTGDVKAMDTVVQIGGLWVNDPTIVSYRNGKVEGDAWSEQLLGTAMEGIWYAWLATGEPKLYDAFAEIVTTMHLHATSQDLSSLGVDFVGQSCLVHSQEQAQEGSDPSIPWCSPWQMATLLDSLLQYRELSGDSRVDAILVAFGRFLRDGGTTYGVEEYTLCDSFLEPVSCYTEPLEDEDPRILLPLYGGGMSANGKRLRMLLRDEEGYMIGGEFSHCPEVSALMAASWLALRNHPEWDAGAVGPFASEKDSFEAVYQELGAC
ncbi:MAG TPA: hypothetical protein PLA94_12400, partial [Myxococcota bacterium]|nr:hypothetical protein [Myxococcota bacterium]